MSEVYFVSSRATENKSLIEKLIALINRVGNDFVDEGDLVAIKLHMGEEGGTRYLRPIFVSPIVSLIKERGGKPFLTDTNTLYIGKRKNAVDHLELAISHGFSYATIGAPVIIADGLISQDYVEVEVNLPRFKKVRIASAIYYADALVVLTHFKGHMITSFGGAIKNLGMGAAPRSGKQQMHAHIKPELRREELCIGCGECVAVCPVSAIKIIKGKASFDLKRCIGCGDCITICRQGAIRILWNEAPEVVAEKTVETAYAAWEKKRDKTVFFNFLLDITPDCDCFTFSDNPIVPDIGILASRDPVAIDQASVDLVNQQQGLKNSKLTSGFNPGEDKFRALFPDVDWRGWLSYAERIGLGTRRYRLINVTL